VELRIASYNVHRCVGVDGKRDVARVAAVIREIDPDVIGLQEIECGYHDQRGRDQVDELQEFTNLTGISGPTVVRRACIFGNALFTRRPVVAVRHADLSRKRREPRAALDVDLELGASSVARMIVTHFGLSPWERRSQTSTLLAALRDNERDLTILCGDFNEWIRRWPTVRELDTFFGPSKPLTSFPSRRPFLALDRIWVRPAAALTKLWIHRTPLSSAASDHLPICAQVAITE
jgi:endonuclease/exonuclease/phosphatase family metal-dependent hydrolase